MNMLAIDSFVRLFVVCFAAGVWWLQSQSALPVVDWYWGAPLLAVALLVLAPVQSTTMRHIYRVFAAGACVLCGSYGSLICSIPVSRCLISCMGGRRYSRRRRRSVDASALTNGAYVLSSTSNVY
jgi:hypothetical protein